jgi:hypothetical protein
VSLHRESRFRRIGTGRESLSLLVGPNAPRDNGLW